MTDQRSFFAAPTPLRSGDVRRRIQHKAGPFVLLPSQRPYLIVETRDGRFLREFEDGTRESCPALKGSDVQREMSSGEWVEV